MDLWIRSTLKGNLVKCNCLSLIDGKNVYENKDIEYNMHIICQCWADRKYTPLGAYKTRERALEVLDEIQRYLDMKPIMKLPKVYDYQEAIKNYSDGFILIDNETDIIPVNTKVYEMPKE